MNDVHTAVSWKILQRGTDLEEVEALCYAVLFVIKVHTGSLVVYERVGLHASGSLFWESSDSRVILHIFFLIFEWQLLLIHMCERGREEAMQYNFSPSCL